MCIVSEQFEKYVVEQVQKISKLPRIKIVLNIAFARGGAHLPIAHALRLLFLDEIEIEKK